MSDSDQAPVDVPRDPSLEAILELHAELVRDSIHVMLPGKIISYDATKQSAVVQPLLKYRHLAEDGQTIVAEDLPQIHNCPVVFMGPARGRMTWPVAAGDICEIRFSSASLARWVAMAPGPTVDPGDDRRHDLADAVCCVGLHSPASPPTDAPIDAIVLHADLAGSGIRIKLGSSGASQSGVQGDNFHSALNTFLAALSTFATAISTFAGTCTTTPATTPAATLATAATTFESACSTLEAAAYLSNVVRLD